jgi:hypothetical protein
MKLFTLGTSEDDLGNRDYDPRLNPLLQQGVTGVAANGQSQGMHPRNFATPLAARIIAGIVGGRVVRDPMGSNWETSHPCLAIKVGDVVANAGAVCMVMGNDNGQFSTPRGKSWEICGLLGIERDDALADKLYEALT